MISLSCDDMYLYLELHFHIKPDIKTFKHQSVRISGNFVSNMMTQTCLELRFHIKQYYVDIKCCIQRLKKITWFQGNHRKVWCIFPYNLHSFVSASPWRFCYRWTGEATHFQIGYWRPNHIYTFCGVQFIRQGGHFLR